MNTQIVVSAALWLLCTSPLPFAQTPDSRLQQGEHKDADPEKRLFLAAIEKGGLDSNRLGYAYICLGYIEGLAENRDQALAWFTKASALQHASPEVLGLAQAGLETQITGLDGDCTFQLGAMQLQQKNYQEAEESFRRLYEYPDTRGLAGLTEVYAAQGQYDRAIQMLRSELTKSPDDDKVRFYLANSAVRAGKYDMAEEQFKLLISKEPREDLYLRLADTYRRAGDRDRAIECYRKAAELAPTDPNPHLQLALLLEFSGRKKEAYDLYQKTLDLQPDNAIALNNLAYGLADTGGDLDRALAMARKAKELSPQNAEVADTLGWIYIKKNLSDNAAEIFRGLVANYPGNPTYYYHYGLALLQKGDKAGAKEQLETALRAAPSSEDEGKIKELLSGMDKPSQAGTNPPQ